ncbi:MarR family winged helix-turn-helix transcriptional regulator [Phenylobacterium soli]|uniref:MarR family transcriptional regulator n=1 Tax=Phenylobacterium soli TaxID=2170551 RepID=A0A328ABF1_9CAUL|nr:MarR family winged helix-turn-helix transcriptional regulator [Phenylobacterium soli]RAK51970.1 MarR family transcriptional regulator [Phenylobacterium soli]
MSNTDTLPSGAAASTGRSLDLGDLRTLLGFHLRMAHVAMYRDFTASLAELDLTQKQCATLELIDTNRGVSQVDLANTLGTDRATMMAMIDRLENRDLVERRRSQEDRRRQELYLTDKGDDVLKKAKAAIAAHEKRFTSRFSDAELKALVKALRRINEPA